MAYQTLEYKEKIIFTYDQAKKARNAQQDMYDSGIVSPSTGTLTSLLSTVTAILPLVFITSTAAGVALGVTSIGSSLIGSEKTQLKSQVQGGIYDFQKVLRLFESNSNYSQVEVELVFLEYRKAGAFQARFFTSGLRITRAKIGGVWMEQS